MCGFNQHKNPQEQNAMNSYTHHNLNLPFAHLQIMLIVDVHPLQGTTHSLVCFHQEHNRKATYKNQKKKDLSTRYQPLTDWNHEAKFRVKIQGQIYKRFQLKISLCENSEWGCTWKLSDCISVLVNEPLFASLHQTTASVCPLHQSGGSGPHGAAL